MPTAMRREVISVMHIQKYPTRSLLNTPLSVATEARTEPGASAQVRTSVLSGARVLAYQAARTRVR